ncbi:hypothetical protein VTP01DRAFT_6911 [Rhizomucor pusillus]|uniref:uncharacterized protein n=1 Tax=Rhizomucor pusillus TaxID=4840 RepID=UPI0037442B6F
MHKYLRNLPCESIHGSDTMQTEVAKKDVEILMKEASVKRVYTLYTDQDKLPRNSWISTFVRLKDGPSSMRIPIASSRSVKKNGRPRILGEEHKRVILEYVDKNPSAVLEQLMERLLQRFEGLKVSKSTVYDFVRKQCNLSLKKARFQPVDRNSGAKIQERLDWVRKWEGTDMDFRTNCVYLDESAFHVNMKRSMAWSKKGSPAIVTVPKTRAQTTTILGAISASGLINCSLRLPQPPAKKRKRGGCAGLMNTGTVTAKYITSRGYRYVYLPSYSPELNPIEQFWSVVKSKVKRSRFLEKETLTTRINEPCNRISLSDFEGFVSHSHKCSDKCRNREHL